MLGAIAGDIIGSVRENLRIKRKDFELFPKICFYTDDTVLTVAVADAILNGKSYGKTIKEYARRHPLRGYGPRFMMWMLSPGDKPYNSFGNGSAMRVSPVAYAYNSQEDVLRHAKESAERTHNHPEGIKGAQAVSLAVFLARTGSDKDQIRKKISDMFNYDLTRSVDDIRPDYRIDITCPPAPFLKLLLPFWIQRILKMLFVMPYPWEVTRIRRPPSPVLLPKHIIKVYLLQSLIKRGQRYPNLLEMSLSHSLLNMVYPNCRTCQPSRPNRGICLPLRYV